MAKDKLASTVRLGPFHLSIGGHTVDGSEIRRSPLGMYKTL